jgi:predicted regulator of Ras-like GTPase activity (Roadblock/LC7/MglB family)
MANNMKTKFTGLFRGWFGRNDSATPPPSEPVRSAAAASSPVTPPPAAAKTTNPFTPRYTTAEAAPAPSANGSEQLEIPLIAIINALPMDLKAKMIAVPTAGKTVALQVEAVIAQLAFGAVKITFGELRQLAPGTFVNGDSVYDSRPVSVPLNEILMRINPTLLARRPAAQKFEVDDEITGPFGGHGRGIAFTANPLKPSAQTAAPARSAMPAPPTSPAREVKPAAPVSFTPPASPVTPPISAPRPPAPAPAPTPAPTPAPPKSEPIAFSPLRQTAPLVAPIPFAEPSKPTTNGNGNGNHTNGNGNGNGHSHGAPTLPPFKFTAAPVPPSATPELPLAAQPTLAVSLRELAENWPDEIKREIVQNGLANLNVPLPMVLIEPGLKRGRVTMAWKELRTLINPQSLVSLSDDLGLELPLKVLAPAFLIAQKKLAPVRAKVAVSAEIPNLFFGFPQPEPVAPAAFTPTPLPTALSLAPQESMPTAAAPRTLATQKPGDTNIFSFSADGSAALGESNVFRRTPAPATEFSNKPAQPKDVVVSAVALPGVAGAVVALADGLRVAGEVPADVNADAISAFLPQIFERVNQSTRELRMGALNNVGFTVGNVPWKIFRVNSVYFAVFGRAGEALPKSQLAALAAGLDRKQK